MSGESTKGQAFSVEPRRLSEAKLARVEYVVDTVQVHLRLRGCDGLTERERLILEQAVAAFLVSEPCLCTPMGEHCVNVQGCPVHGRPGR